MHRTVYFARHLALGVAFVVVMAGTGALLGAIAGVLLLLLSRVVLGASASMVQLMPLSMLAGTFAWMAVGVFMAARQAVRLDLQPRLIPIRHAKSDHPAA